MVGKKSLWVVEVPSSLLIILPLLTCWGSVFKEPRSYCADYACIKNFEFSQYCVFFRVNFYGSKYRV